MILEGRKSIMWTTDELDRVGNAEELQLASRRPDGSLRGFVTIWVVRDGDDIYVRSAHGADNPWYVRALASGEGRIRSGGVERDVAFDHLDDGRPDARHDRRRLPLRSTALSTSRRLGPVVADGTHGVTLRLVPKE